MNVFLYCSLLDMDGCFNQQLLTRHIHADLDCVHTHFLPCIQCTPMVDLGNSVRMMLHSTHIYPDLLKKEILHFYVQYGISPKASFDLL